jgi:hypothetical protein
MRYRLTLASFLVACLAAANASAGYAQTAPPGAAAPVPQLPVSTAPPPATIVPQVIGDVPIQSVSFAYFGNAAVVDELLLPQLVKSNSSLHIWSAPDATAEEQVGQQDFGTRPAGTQFIVFFVRGTRMYVFDTSSGNYGWADSDVSRV